MFVVPAAIADAMSVEDDTPFTFEVMIVPASERPFELTAVVVEVTPLTSDVSTLADEVMVLLPITDDVALTPLIVVVRTLPVRD